MSTLVQIIAAATRQQAITWAHVDLDRWRHMLSLVNRAQWVNTLRPGQDGRHFPDDIFKYIFLNENDRIPIQILLKFVIKGPINNIPALVQVMAWHRTGDKPLSEAMMA